MVKKGENIEADEIVYFLCEDGWDEQIVFELAMEFASKSGKNAM